MKLQHLIDFYMDGYKAVSYCKICSAEGDQLFEDCKGPFVSGLAYFKGLTKEEFEEKYKNALDGKKQTDK